MNENETLCKNCNCIECRCKNLGIINRRHDYLTHVFDTNNMCNYFGIMDTDYSKYTVSLSREDHFIYRLTIKKLNLYNPLTTYIRELPRDMNNLIYSYLSDTNFIMKINILLPNIYPFASPVWTILSYVKNGKPQNALDETRRARCLLMHSSPAMTLDKEILYYTSGLLS